MRRPPRRYAYLLLLPMAIVADFFYLIADIFNPFREIEK